MVLSEPQRKEESSLERSAVQYPSRSGLVSLETSCAPRVARPMIEMFADSVLLLVGEIKYPTASCRREGAVPVKIFSSSAEFREWLETNHDRVPELWLGFHNKRSDKKGITYREALDEALCFGWIDGVRKSINETTYKQRFSPRRPKSYWSAVNIRRMGELAKLGRIAPSGGKVFEQRASNSGKYSFESRPRQLPAGYERQFKATPGAWEFFRAQAPWYQRTSSFWVVSAKQEETRQRRLATLISDSEKGRRLGMLTPKGKKSQDSENRPQTKKERG